MASNRTEQGRRLNRRVEILKNKEKMRKSVVTLFALCVAGIICAQNTETPEKSARSNEILWSPDYIVTWDDFKANAVPSDLKNPKKTLIAALMYSVISIRTEYDKEDGEYVLTVEAKMIKNKSYKNKKLINDLVLKHEIVHFDITELYARKFRKLVSERTFKIKTFKKSIDKEFKKLLKELSEAQSRYETETGYGIIAEKQKEWIEYIKEELDRLEDFSSTKGKLNFIQ